MQLDARGVASRCRITPHNHGLLHAPTGRCCATQDSTHNERRPPTHKHRIRQALSKVTRFASNRPLCPRRRRRRRTPRHCPTTSFPLRPTRVVRLKAVELDVGCDDLFVARLEELVQPVLVADCVVLGELRSLRGWWPSAPCRRRR